MSCQVSSLQQHVAMYACIMSDKVCKFGCFRDRKQCLFLHDLCLTRFFGGRNSMPSEHSNVSACNCEAGYSLRATHRGKTDIAGKSALCLIMMGCISAVD